MYKTQTVSLIAVFGALHAVLGFLSLGIGPWRNWAVYLEPFEGIILGPQVGFIAALLGSSIARMAGQSSDWMFGVIAEPLSVLMAGLLARARWKPVLAIYAVMLSAYFIDPLGRELPVWAVLDILLVLFLIYPAAKLSINLFEKNVRPMSIALAVISFTVIATDSLTRVFLLVPSRLYTLFFPDFGALYFIFVKDAIFSYFEDFIAIAVSFLVGVPLLLTVFKMQHGNKQGQNAAHVLLQPRESARWHSSGYLSKGSLKLTFIQCIYRLKFLRIITFSTFRDPLLLHRTLRSIYR
jgi:predicted membrane protein